MRIIGSRRNKTGDANLLLNFDQRRVLEALRNLKRATVTEISQEIDRTRTNMRVDIRILMKRGYVSKVGEVAPAWKGRTPGYYEWTGKEFRPSAELAPNRINASELVSPPPEIALLVNSINAMIHIGRSAA
jgi:hypothetical protein